MHWWNLRGLVKSFFVTALIAFVTVVASAEDRPQALPLPDGIPVEAETKEACFAPGELDRLAADVESQRVALSGCARGVVRPVVEISSARFYSGNGGYSCEGVRKNAFLSPELDTFRKELIEASEDPERAWCAANMMYLWAKSGAMTVIKDPGRGQTALDRMWTTLVIANAYLTHPKVRASAAGMNVGFQGEKTTKHQVIAQWLEGLGTQIAAEAQRQNENGDGGKVNTQFFRGFTLLSLGLITENPNFVAMAKSIHMTAMKEIEVHPEDHAQDGFLPEELKRGKRAVGYQAFATYPIVGMSLLSQAYGCDFVNSAWKKNQVNRVMRKSIEGRLKPEVFAQKLVDVGFAPDLKAAQQNQGTDPMPMLWLLENAADTKPMADSIKKFVKSHTGVLPVSKHARIGYFGGNLANFIATLEQLKTVAPPENLKGLCQ